MKLITGHSGEAHITAADDGAFNAIVYTDGKFVFDTGKKFAIEKLSDNSVRIYDGYAMNQGRKLGIEKDDYEELVLENGMQNKKRADLIVIRYARDVDTGIESAELAVITGLSGSEYEDPEMLQGDIVAGDIEDDMPLYRIRFNGLEMEGIDPLFEMFNKQLSSEDYTTDEKEKLKNIDENANNYTHPATAGNKHIPSGGSAGQVLKYGGSSGAASWGSDSYYGTCSTAAATAAKTVSLSGFSLFTGATVAVMFSNGNTAANPTLNINSTGAKPIYYRNAALTSSTAGIISKNGVYLFVYSGSYWRLVGDVGSIAISEVADKLSTPRTIDGVSFDGSADIVHFGVCTTAASTAAKTVSISGFTLVTGARVIVIFNNGNTATNPTLNVNGTGAKQMIRPNGEGSFVGLDTKEIENYGVYEFVYNGSYWYTGILAGLHNPFFTSVDTDSNVTSWTPVETLATREGFSSILNKISTMFKNVRYLYKLLGKTDISAIGDGTVTGILSQNLAYKDFSSEITKLNASAPDPVCYVENGTVYILGGFIAKNATLAGNLFQVPKKYAPRAEVVGSASYPSSAVDAGKILSISINAAGIVSYYQKEQLSYSQRFTIQYPLKTS